MPAKLPQKQLLPDISQGIWYIEDGVIKSTSGIIVNDPVTYNSLMRITTNDNSIYALWAVHQGDESAIKGNAYSTYNSYAGVYGEGTNGSSGVIGRGNGTGFGVYGHSIDSNAGYFRSDNSIPIIGHGTHPGTTLLVLKNNIDRFEVNGLGEITSFALIDTDEYLLKNTTDGKIEKSTIKESDVSGNSKYQHDGYLNLQGSATAPNGSFGILTGTGFIVPRAGIYKLRMIYFMRFDSVRPRAIYMRIGKPLASTAVITSAIGHGEVGQTSVNGHTPFAPIDLSQGNGYIFTITPQAVGQYQTIELTAHIDIQTAGDLQVEIMSTTTRPYTFELAQGSYIDVREV